MSIYDETRAAIIRAGIKVAVKASGRTLNMRELGQYLGCYGEDDHWLRGILREGNIPGVEVTKNGNGPWRVTEKRARY